MIADKICAMQKKTNRTYTAQIYSLFKKKKSSFISLIIKKGGLATFFYFISRLYVLRCLQFRYRRYMIIATRLVELDRVVQNSNRCSPWHR